MLPPHTLQKLLHRLHLSVGIDVLSVSDADADKWQVLWRAHGDVPDPVALSKKMMCRKVRNVGSLLLLQGPDTAQNLGIEIHQPEPENVFLFLNGRSKLQQLREHPVPARGINQPARIQCV